MPRESLLVSGCAPFILTRLQPGIWRAYEEVRSHCHMRTCLDDFGGRSFRSSAEGALARHSLNSRANRQTDPISRGNNPTETGSGSNGSLASVQTRLRSAGLAKIGASVFVALLNLMVISCATVTRGSTQSLAVTSEPTGATVSTTNGLVGVTPVTLTVARRRGFIVRIEKDGYEPAEVHVAPRVHGAGGAALAGNLLLGGVIGAAVDSTTGAIYDLEPNPVSVILRPVVDNGPNRDDRSADVIERTLTEIEALGLGVIAYRKRVGVWPTSLDELTSYDLQGIEFQLVDPWDTPYRYEINDDAGGFYVAAAGSDRTFDPSSWPSTPATYESLRPDAVVRGTKDGVVLTRKWSVTARSNW